MAAGTPISGKSAKVRVNNTAHYAEEWDVEPEADLLDANSFEGGGYKDYIAGLFGAGFTVRGWYDAGANPFDAPMNIQIGTVLTNVKIYVNDTTGPFWNFPKAIVATTPHKANVKGRVELSFTAKGKGTFSYPTGNAA